MNTNSDNNVNIFSNEAGVESESLATERILDSKEHGFYNDKYISKLNSINQEDLDSKFGQIYQNVTYSLGTKTYDGSEIFIVKYEDGTNHLVDSNNNKVDLITGEPIKSNKSVIVLFKESSAFYELYKLGLINNYQLEITSAIIEQALKWDGHKHYQTADLIAEKEASELYQKEFGS